MVKVTAAEFQRHIGRYQDVALKEPVTITDRGRERLVVVSVEEYRRLKRKDRQALDLSEIDDDLLKAIEQAEVPTEYAHLDEEIRD